jgi:hypothetical protein
MTVTIRYGSPEHPDSSITPYRSLVRHTAPVVEPVSLAEAKAQCRVDGTDEDAYLASLISTAREYVENVLGMSLVSQVWEARYDTFPLWEIVLPRPPMQAETVTVTYRDEGGSMQTITSAANAFQVDARTTPGNVPQPVKSLIMRLVAHWFEMRQPVVAGYSQVLPVPQTFETLLAASGWGEYR